MTRQWGRYTYEDYKVWRGAQGTVNLTMAKRQFKIPVWLVQQWMMEYEEERRDNLSRGG